MHVDVETPQILEWLVGSFIAFFSILFVIIWHYYRKQFSDAEDRMKKLEAKVDELFSKKLSKIEKDLGVVQADVKNLGDQVEAHNKIYESRLTELIGSALTPISMKIDSLHDKLS